MFTKLATIFRIPELRKKIFITLLFLMVYRIGYYIPLPMIDQQKVADRAANQATGGLNQVLGYLSMFSGGDLSQGTIFALGIMPYISASIIIQLLSSGVVPSLEKLRKEGEAGRKKINEFTRYLTVPICLVQASFFVGTLLRDEGEQSRMVAITGYTDSAGGLFFYSACAVLIMTAGCLFLMWIGEQIDEYGIGNGVSLIIMAGIISRIPAATASLLFIPGTLTLNKSLFQLGGEAGVIGLEKLIMLILLFVGVVVAVVAITRAVRKIPTQSARHARGRRQVGGAKQSLPMKVNTSGVMPVIFASTLLVVPTFLFQIIQSINPQASWAGSLAGLFGANKGWLYNVAFIALIYIFCYFWVAITFNPKEVAENLKDMGSFIPGYRPGKSTADYLERVLMRITYVGAAFLAVIAIIPTIVSSELGIPPQIAAFYGGTGLLIVISVCLDLVQKINAHLVMRNYAGLTDE